MSHRLTGGDVPYFRTVPSSPSNEDEGLADEDEPPTADQQMTSLDQKAQIAEDDEETILRRRLLEKKLEKEKAKTKTVAERVEQQQQQAKEEDREQQHSQQKEKPKREKIVWEKEKKDAQSAKASRRGKTAAEDKFGQKCQSKDVAKPSSASLSSLSSITTAATVVHHRRRDESATTVVAPSLAEHRHRRRKERQQQQRGGESATATLSSTKTTTATTTTTTSSRDHYHNKQHRQQSTVDDNEKRKDRGGGGGAVAAGHEQQKRRQQVQGGGGGGVDEPAAMGGADEAVTKRKRRHHQVAKAAAAGAAATTTDVEAVVVTGQTASTEEEPSSSPAATIIAAAGAGVQQQQQEEVVVEVEEEEEQGEEKTMRTAKKKEAKRKKFSKFESSSEEEEEDEEEEEEEDVAEFVSLSDEEGEEAEEGEKRVKSEGKEEKQRRGGGQQVGAVQGGGGGEQQQRQMFVALNEQELNMEEYFGMDERHFRSRAGTVDTEMNGANPNGEGEEEEDDDGMDIGDDELAENKEFDQLTEEEKAFLSPEMLSQKEDRYQRRLVAMLPVYYPGISGCRSVAEYECLNKISEGTFGVVYRAQNKRTDEIVALKRLKMEKEHQGFPITSLREINMLLKCGAHPNIVNVREVVVGSSMDKIYLVMDFVEHDVKALIELMKSRGKKWTIPQVKTLLRQLIAGVLYMHDQYVIHRDLKTSNLLLSHQGILKIGDFGLAREFGDPIKPYTPVVVTLWYRAPELLLGTKLYSTPIDMWSVGCIFAEFLKLDPLFPGRTEIDQMQRIFKEVGTPNEQIWPGCMELAGMKTGIFADTPYNQLRRKFAAELPDDDGFELLNKLLTLNPSKRLDAETAVVSKWFNNDPKPAHPSSFPTWPAKSEQNRRPLKDPSSAADAGRGQQQPPPRPTGGFTLRFDAPKF